MTEGCGPRRTVPSLKSTENSGGPSHSLPFARDLARPRADLAVSFRFYEHITVLPVVPLVQATGPDASVRDLETLLLCAQCNLRGWVVLSINWRDGER